MARSKDPIPSGRGDIGLLKKQDVARRCVIRVSFLRGRGNTCGQASHWTMFPVRPAAFHLSRASDSITSTTANTRDPSNTKVRCMFPTQPGGGRRPQGYAQDGGPRVSCNACHGLFDISPPARGPFAIPVAVAGRTCVVVRSAGKMVGHVLGAVVSAGGGSAGACIRPDKPDLVGSPMRLRPAQCSDGLRHLRMF